MNTASAADAPVTEKPVAPERSTPGSAAVPLNAAPVPRNTSRLVSENATSSPSNIAEALFGSVTPVTSVSENPTTPAIRTESPTENSTPPEACTTRPGVPGKTLGPKVTVPIVNVVVR